MRRGRVGREKVEAGKGGIGERVGAERDGAMIGSLGWATLVFEQDGRVRRSGSQLFHSGRCGTISTRTVRWSDLLRLYLEAQEGLWVHRAESGACCFVTAGCFEAECSKDSRSVFVSNCK